jgi:hypothetical protein
VKYSTLKIDGDEYRLGYDFNEICDTEALTGCNLLSALTNVGGASGSQLRGLLVAAIRACPYDGMPEAHVLLKKCGQLIRLDTIAPIILALGETYALAVSEEYAARYRAAVSETEEPANAPAAPQPDGDGK